MAVHLGTTRGVPRPSGSPTLSGQPWKKCRVPSAVVMVPAMSCQPWLWRHGGELWMRGRLGLLG
jgi:hypothetical protein